MTCDLNLCKSALTGVGGIILLHENNSLYTENTPVSLSNSMW
jgi:hypothetical protein